MLTAKSEHNLNHTETLSSMVQKDICNDINESELKKCNAQDSILVENVLLIAQAELQMLQLKKISIEIKSSLIKILCPLTNKFKVTLSSLRNIQHYSPARIHEVSVHVNHNETMLCIEIMDYISRVTSNEIDVVRVAKRKRSFFGF